MSFAEDLKMFRKSRELSQEELGEKLGVSRQSVTKWENGLAYPGLDNLITLSKAYGLSLDWLFEEETGIIKNEEPIAIEKIDSSDQELIAGHVYNITDSADTDLVKIAYRYISTQESHSMLCVYEDMRSDDVASRLAEIYKTKNGSFGMSVLEVDYPHSVEKIYDESMEFLSDASLIVIWARKNPIISTMAPEKSDFIVPLTLRKLANDANAPVIVVNG